jgi:hypothetical protein
MKKKNLKVENRNNGRSYVYEVNYVYNPKKGRTDKKKKYCGVFTGTYDTKGNPEFHKAIVERAPIEIINFGDSINTFIENSNKYNTSSKIDEDNINPFFANNTNKTTWSKSVFTSLKSNNTLYYSLVFKQLSCKLEIFIPLINSKVYCRFFNTHYSNYELKGTNNIEVLLGSNMEDFSKFSTRNRKNQVLISTEPIAQTQVPKIFEYNGMFIYSYNTAQKGKIKLLVKSYDIVKEVIIPYLPQTPDFIQTKYKKDLTILSKFSTELLNVFLKIQLPKTANYSKLINELLTTNARFIKIDGKWILLEDKISFPIK